MKTRATKKNTPSRQNVEVHLDADIVAGATQVGTLFHALGHGHSVFSFSYDPSWLLRPNAFEIDPDLQLHAGETYPVQRAGVFRIFVDSAPDRWGRLLLDRREVLRARESGLPPRTLNEWDYLLGVHDSCRMGALRFRTAATSPFLDDDHQQAAPPLTRLRELEAASLALEEPDAEDRPEFRQWLTALLAPGSSLGGARPKANYTDADGSLWIAKFPSRDDRRDIGAWEMVVHRLAIKAGLQVPPARLLRLGGRYHTFACRRFDRVAGGGRKFFVSAMTLLNHDDGQSASYLELAEFLSVRGSVSRRRDDLRELWMRVVFNILVSNRDDHLRNHGFILAEDGWRLAPAYDLNPNLDKSSHHLFIDSVDSTPDLNLALTTAPYHGLKKTEAEGILNQVRAVVQTWRAEAASIGLSQTETAAMARAFALAGG